MDEDDINYLKLVSLLLDIDPDKDEFKNSLAKLYLALVELMSQSNANDISLTDEIKDRLTTLFNRTLTTIDFIKGEA